MKNILHKYHNFLSNQKEKKIYRTLKSQYENIIDFCNNDYLALSNHSKLIEASIEYSTKYGVGGTASRLVKNLNIYNDLENKIAQSKKTEAAILFPSGFQANASVISILLDKTILGQEPLVFSDKLNHASIHQGCFIASVRQIRYNNIDLNHLEIRIREYINDNRPKFIITESVFSMDGTKVNIEDLCYLSEKYNCFLYVDEAHSTGLYGKDGYGITSDFSKLVNISMGTFSKAVGVMGGYIACSQSLKDYIINRSTGFICTTALSPSIIGAIDSAWDMIPKLETERENLFKNAIYLRKTLKDNDFDLIDSDTNIIAVIIKDEKKLLDLQQYLINYKIIVGAIRPPIVPPLTSRLRISLNINHTKSDIDKLINYMVLWKNQ